MNILNDNGKPLDRLSKLDEIADHLDALLSEQHFPELDSADGRRWDDQEHNSVRIDCGKCFHYADYNLALDRWIVRKLSAPPHNDKDAGIAVMRLDGTELSLAEQREAEELMELMELLMC